MDVPGMNRGGGASRAVIIEKLPVLSRYANTRGWPYVISWIQRVTGIGLILFLAIPLCARLPLQAAGIYHAGAPALLPPVFLFLVWASSLAVGFHALNGGRLILYELFGKRGDAAMIRWVLALCVAFAATVGLMMVMKNQYVSPFSFWLITFFPGAVIAYVVASRIGKKRHSLLWKLQRISGAFLFIAAPAYLLFLQLNPYDAAGAQGTVTWLQSAFSRFAALTLAAYALYHAGYGLFSIAADYTPSRTLRIAVTALMATIIAVIAALVCRFILPV